MSLLAPTHQSESSGGLRPALELADVIAFTASPRASYLSGESIVVDGSPGAYSYVRALNEAKT